MACYHFRQSAETVTILFPVTPLGCGQLLHYPSLTTTNVGRLACFSLLFLGCRLCCKLSCLVSCSRVSTKVVIWQWPYACMHYTHRHTYVHTDIGMDTQIHAHTHKTYIHTCTDIHTHMHTCTQTHTHTHTHTRTLHACMYV
jgi:hypothetical protein